MRVISNNPAKIEALEAGLKVMQRVPIKVESGKATAHYCEQEKADSDISVEFPEE